MMRIRGRVGAAIVTATVAAAGVSLPARATWEWHLPSGVRPPDVPADAPMSPALVDLGRHLFYDTRLSANGTQSCATCHEQARAFTDGRAQAVGSTGVVHTRNSMSLVNVAYAETLTWAHPTLRSLDDQARVPMYGTAPVELGLSEGDDRWLDRFTGDFERDETAISDSAKRGEMLFHSRPLSCFTCHGGVHFSDAMSARRDRPAVFHNTGLYNLTSGLSYPVADTGLHVKTGAATDVGRFKTPTLRNISVTGPYMHDGSIATLGKVIDHYADGGRTIAAGANRGIGHDNPLKDEAVRGFWLTTGQRADLLAFLESLTDAALLTDPRFADPWTRR